MTAKQPLFNLDKDKIDELYKHGAFLIVDDMPQGTEFGVDYASWSIGPKFRGLKMIPPGLHFVFYSAVSKEGTVAPRTGFFHCFKEKEILVKRYDTLQETIVDSDTQYQPKCIDTMLAPYPYHHYHRWCSLTTHVTSTTVTRVQPQCKLIQAATPLLTNPDAAQDVARATSVEDKLDANFIQDDSQIMRFCKVDRKRATAGFSAAQLTQFYMDTTSSLNSLIEHSGSEEELLGELQVAFIVFLLGHVYSAFDQWKRLVDTICRAQQSLSERPNFYKAFIRTLHYHLKETPSDFFVDIVSRNNFLVTTLKLLFEGLREEEGVSGELRSRGDKFRAHLEKYYSWDFSYCEDDDPVVVEMFEPG